MAKGQVNKSRRRFLLATVGGAAGVTALSLGVYLGLGGEKAAPADQLWQGSPPGWSPNAWLRLDADGVVTVRVNHSEMGQGCTTGLPAMLAEEMDADWNLVRCQIAPVEEVYKNPAYNIQLTGGSTSTPTSWEPLRHAGAVARAMLLAAAAARWGVPAAQCRTAKSLVLHPSSGRSLGYGELAVEAAKQTPPANVVLKNPADYTLIGRDLPRLDAPAKAEGRAVYGLDVTLPDMLTATVIQPPVFGDQLKSYKAEAALKMPGVKAVMPIASGLAVVADGYWHAWQAADAVQVTWDGAGNGSLSSQGLWARWEKLIQAEEAKELFARGDAAQALKGAAKVVTAQYRVPYQAHATPEPMNCTALVRPGSCKVWVPTQNQDAAQEAAALVTGLGYHQIRVHTTFLGGGYGRRSAVDYVTQAVELSKALGRPVKVVWSRREDMQHDVYRPASVHRLEAGLDGKGRVIAWRHRIVGPDQVAYLLPTLLPTMMPYWLPRGVRNTGRWAARKALSGLVAGDGVGEGSVPPPYAVENVLVDFLHDEPGVPTGFWRGVASTANAYVMECFVDDIARAAGRDPLELRLELAQGTPRARAALKLIADQAGYGKPLSAGSHWGLACHEFHGTMVAMAALVGPGDGGMLSLRRVVAAVDCGRVITPYIVRDQIIGGVAFGLSATTHGAITLQDGRVQQTGYDDFPIVRIGEMPPVEVHIIESKDAPKGIGESGVPPIAPAVANAVAWATGKPVRELPFAL